MGIPSKAAIKHYAETIGFTVGSDSREDFSNWFGCPKLGNGLFSAAYDTGFDYVVRVCLTNKSRVAEYKSEDGYEWYLENVIKNARFAHNTHVPKIKESFTVNSKDGKEYLVVIMEKLVPQRKEWKTNRSDLEKTSADMKALVSYIASHAPYHFDLHQGNTMKRGRTYVLTDPLSWRK